MSFHLPLRVPRQFFEYADGIRNELDTSMALTGVNSIAEIDRRAIAAV